MMPHVFSNQNTQTNTANNNPSAAAPKSICCLSRILKALFPCAAYRAAQNMGQRAAGMQTPAHTNHMGGVAASNRDTATQNLEYQLLSWQEAAPLDERESRNTAANAIRECINNERNDLDLSRLGLTSLPENIFENIPSLRTLILRNNALTSLDAKSCAKLEGLYIENNHFQTLDLSNCGQLRFVNCTGNEALTSLHLRNCGQLEDLHCNGNRLSILNLSRCAQLQHVYCNDNQLSTLDFGHLNHVRYLNCSNNQLTSLDLSGCLQAINVQAYGNARLTDLTVPHSITREGHHITIADTGVRWEDLSEDVRNRPDIYIDIRPAQPREANTPTPVLNQAESTPLRTLSSAHQILGMMISAAMGGLAVAAYYKASSH